MFSSELQLSPATAKLFHLEQFAIYGIPAAMLFIILKVHMISGMMETA